jgi:hypothetical protein
MAVSGFSELKSKEDNKGNASTAADDAKGKAQELASSVAQTAQEVASDVKQKAQDWAAIVADKAQETATAAVDRTDDGIAAVGHNISALGTKVRHAAPEKGMLGSAANTVADKLQAGGHYLEEHGVKEMGKDITNMVRRYPTPALLVSFGLGCLLGWTLKRS